MASRLKVKIGTPEHGWLPVRISAADFELEFAASDVAVDSIEQLVSSLASILDGQESEVVWFLEPTEYRFRFSMCEDGVLLSILESSSEKIQHKEIYRFSGSADETLSPFWRALREYSSSKENLKAWRHEFPEREMEMLTRRVKDLG